ncbi:MULTISPECIES: SGNH/GDSL hydrolase family protein [Rhizobium/Agrobacterium group]|uniref:SGNH/GDSL hydrolase family protein n=1 Tax=Rhizobium oryzihabitans TaxID=2267833 RepID=UPI004033D03A
MIGLGLGLSLGLARKPKFNPGALPKLKAASIAAAGNNPVELPDLASPPTVAFSASTDASLVVVAPTVNANPLIYKSSGKRFSAFSDQWLTMAHLSVAPRSDGNIKVINTGREPTSPTVPANGYDQGNNWNIRFKATGLQVFEFSYPQNATNAPVRIIVDGRYIARDGHAVNGVSTSRVKVTFATAATREIEIEIGTSHTFAALKVNAGATLIEPTRRPKAVVVGTSFEEALLIGAYTSGTFIKDAAGVIRYAPWDSHFATFCKLNGYDYRNSGLGGTGYSATAGAQNIVGQMDYWIADDTYDLIVFGGPYNDKDLNQTTMRTNARAAWEKARLNQPNAVIIVQGCCGGAGVTNNSSSTITAEANLKAEFDAWIAAGEKKAYFIPVSPNYATALIKDTNYTDWISTDNTHPYRGDATHGHVGIGYYFNTKWRALIGA